MRYTIKYRDVETSAVFGTHGTPLHPLKSARIDPLPVFFVAPKAHFRRLQSDPVLGFLSVRYTYIHTYIQLLLCRLGEWLGLVHALWRSRIETLDARASSGPDSLAVIRVPVLQWG